MTRRIVLLFAAVAAILVLWTGAWFFGAAFIRGEVASLAGSSPSLSCAGLDIGGYPFRYDLSCSDAQIASADLTLGVTELRASVLVYMPTHVLIFAKGPARLGDAFSGAAYRLDWNNLEASIRLDLLSLGRASLVADGIVLSDTVLDPTEIARARHAEAHARGVEGASGKDNRNIEFFLKLAEATTRQNEAPIAAEASALLTEWPSDIRRWGDRQALVDWAAGAGDLRITAAQLESGPLTAGLTGTLAPDEKGLVEGSLDLTSRGLAPILRQFFAAPLAGALLGPEDETGETHQRLVFAHSIMRAGVVPVLELPPLF